MTSAGLVGGLGPESTIDYYRRILDHWARVDPATSPSIVIDSLDVGVGLRLAASDHPGGTELPLLLRAAEVVGLSTLHSTALRVAAIVERMTAG